ncbi:hypothetical protein OPR95_001733 [Enterococcus hirae]|nr:hypothetical protein [Enterococcus hirae]EMF0159406.1 hypothetical protein [Enterococcus hirae]
MKVSEAIEKLTNKRNDALSFMSDIYKKGDAGYLANEIRVTTYNIAINTLEQIDEPQGEKVEVTEKQAELLRAFKGESIYELLTNCLVEDEELMAKARLFGYTVKPKRWVVKAPNGKYFISLAYGSGIGSLAKCSAKTKDDAYPFDDKAKAEAVATLVEGSVEEV